MRVVPEPSVSGDPEQEAFCFREAAMQAVYRLLAGHSVERPPGSPSRVLAPGERIVLSVEDGAVVGRWVQAEHG